MTPQELLETTPFKKYNAYSKDLKPLNDNYYKECVIGYYKCEMGTIFIIKSKIKYYTYTIIKEEYAQTYSRRLVRHYSNEQISKMMSVIQEKGMIIKKSSFKEMFKKLVSENI